MQISKLVLTFLCAMGATACATRPELVTKYYPAKATAKIEVTQSVACAGEGADKRILYATAATVGVIYTANTDVTPHTFSSAQLGGAGANTDLGLEFYPDGRLKGLNWTATGKGDEAVKAAIALGKAAVGARLTGGDDPCDIVAREGGGKPLTLTYQAQAPLSDAARVEVGATLPSLAVRKQIGDALPKIEFVVGAPQPRARSAEAGRYNAGSVALLTLNDVATVDLAVELVSKEGVETIWQDSATTPAASAYQLAIPKAALFGKTTFKLGLSESGAISTIGYASDTGVASAMGAGTAVLAEFAQDDLAKQVADTKAKADLIAAQQRLLRCEADPKACT